MNKYTFYSSMSSDQDGFFDAISVWADTPRDAWDWFKDTLYQQELSTAQIMEA